MINTASKSEIEKFGSSARRLGTPEDLAVEVQAHTRVQFVENLEIEILGSGRLWYSDQTAAFGDRNQAQAASANIDAASIVTFVDGLSQQQKEDVLNSTLLAQLAANKQHDRERDMAGWYGTYRCVLEKVGWVSQQISPKDRILAARSLPANVGPLVIQNPLGVHLPDRVVTLPFRPVLVTAPRFTPGAVALQLLQPVSSANEIALTEASIESLQRLPARDRRTVIFESSSHSSLGGNFQIVLVKLSDKGTILMLIAAFFFRTNEPVDRVVSFNFGRRNTNMFQARHIMELDELAYARVREHVIAQLGDQAAMLIDDLPI
jgi:hypothetical protein